MCLYFLAVLFVTSDQINIDSKEKIKVKGCKAERILYVYLPQEKTAHFFLCKKNVIDMERRWNCCN